MNLASLLPTMRAKTATLCAALALTATLGTAVHAQTIDSIKKKGTLVVGVQADQVPWGFIDANGANAGYDVEVAKLMAEDLGVKLELVRTTVPNRIATLMTNKVDILAAVMGMYPDRAKVVQFSKPYSNVDIQVYGKKSDTIKDMNDLSKFRIGVSRASAIDIALTKGLPPGTPLQRFDDDSVPIQALISNQVDAIGGTSTYGPVLAKSPGGDKFELKFTISRQFNGLTVRPGQKEFNAWTNEFIDRNMANGKLNAINRKWMGVDLPQMPTELPGIPFTVQ